MNLDITGGQGNPMNQMIPANQNVVDFSQRKIYFQMGTRNKSFLDMHKYLEAIGIKNNKFMLTLLDPDLAYVDPHDPNLNQYYKSKVLAECMVNFWYFVREVVRVPAQGGSGTGSYYTLTRGGMALFFCTIYNYNIFLDLPRQQGKTLSASIWYLWAFNFATSNSTFAFMHKSLDGSKKNLLGLKDLRDCLPSYLQMTESFTVGDKKTKAQNSVMTLSHSINRNRIITVASARTRVAAQSLLRGMSVPLWWADEWAFAPYNEDIYLNAIPAWKRAAMNSEANGAPFGILFTTTPGFLTDEMGRYANNMREDATPFSENWYDLTKAQIDEIKAANMRSSFVYIRFTYQQLGRSEEWFKQICIDMQNKWEAIRREVLLEWADFSENSPFTQDELETVDRLTIDPIATIPLNNNKFTLNMYGKLEYKTNGEPVDPPIIGVDVSGGYKRDSSAITVIDSKTTKVIAILKCNYISQKDLAKCVYEIVTKYMPNAVVNVELNGGFGAAVVSMLMKTKIKKNLYYEFKERILEEVNEGPGKVKRTKKLVKVYGLNSSKSVRELLIQILRERMDNHKDKFISKILYQEFRGLEVKRNGKVDHSATTHDDATFSYLMALYVWYEGKDLKERFGINKSTIMTDSATEEEVFSPEAEELMDITEDIVKVQKDMLNTDTTKKDSTELVNEMRKSLGITFDEWDKRREAEDEKELKEAMKNPVFLQAYATKYNMTKDQVDLYRDETTSTSPSSAYSMLPDEEYSVLQGNLANRYKNL